MDMLLKKFSCIYFFLNNKENEASFIREKINFLEKTL